MLRLVFRENRNVNDMDRNSEYLLLIQDFNKVLILGWTGDTVGELFTFDEEKSTERDFWQEYLPLREAR